MAGIEVAQSKPSQVTCHTPLYRETCSHRPLSTAQFNRQAHRGTLKRKRVACSAVTEDTSRSHFHQTVLEEAPSQTVKWNWREHWYPVAYLKDLDTKAPNSFKLLNEPLCIWHDAEGWRAFSDVCPHRLIPLTEGRISADGNLQCGYHGWEFEGSGSCVAIPQGGNPRNPRACAVAYQAAERQGLLWVRLQKDTGSQPDTSDIPILPEWDEGWIESGTFRDLPYDYSTLLENLLDVGHVPFTHAGSVSKRSSADVITLDVLESSAAGFKGINKKGPRKGQLGAQDTEFRGPCLMRHTINAQDTKGFSNITAVWAVPISPGRCRAIVKNMFLFKSPIPRLVFKIVPLLFSHIGNNRVLEDDVVFLHQQEPLAVERGIGQKNAAQVYFMPGSSDNYVTAFRRWLATVGGGPFGKMDKHWLQAAGPRLSREQLLDRYNSHTQHCALCSKSLRQTQQARSVLKYAAGLLLIWSAVAASVALAGKQPAEAVPLQAGAIPRLLLQVAVRLLPAAEPATLMTCAAVALGAATLGVAARAWLWGLQNKLVTGNPIPARSVYDPKDEASPA